jgi:hypothetical protein
MGATLILPDFILPSRVNQHWQYTGLDSEDQCLNPKHFKSYPHPVTYQYNSRGCRDLDPIYQGQYEIQVVPNIVNITYGRDVGYKIEQETFDDATHAISATKIRKELGLT